MRAVISGILDRLDDAQDKADNKRRTRQSRNKSRSSSSSSEEVERKRRKRRRVSSSSSSSSSSSGSRSDGETSRKKPAGESSKKTPNKSHSKNDDAPGKEKTEDAINVPSTSVGVNKEQVKVVKPRAKKVYTPPEGETALKLHNYINYHFKVTKSFIRELDHPTSCKECNECEPPMDSKLQPEVCEFYNEYDFCNHDHSHPGKTKYYRHVCRNCRRFFGRNTYHRARCSSCPVNKLLAEMKEKSACRSHPVQSDSK